ncbi:MAG: hypothetical protein MHMPM18_005179 [Marteilia pararefringens]
MCSLVNQKVDSVAQKISDNLHNFRSIYLSFRRKSSCLRHAAAASRFRIAQKSLHTQLLRIFARLCYHVLRSDTRRPRHTINCGPLRHDSNAFSNRDSNSTQHLEIVHVSLRLRFSATFYI